MTITQLIYELEKLKQQYGDLEVWRDTDGAIAKVENATIIEWTRVDGSKEKSVELT